MRAIPECRPAGLALPATEERGARVSIQAGDDNGSMPASAAGLDRHSPPGAMVLHRLQGRCSVGCTPRGLRNTPLPAPQAVVGIRTSASHLTDKNAGILTTPRDSVSMRTGPIRGGNTLAPHVERFQRHGLRGGLRTAMWVLGVAWFTSAMAGTPASNDTTAGKVQSAAEQAVREHFGMPGDRIEVAALPLNPRLQLSACDVPLHTSIPQFAKPVSLVTALVQCPQPGGWRVRIPVKMQLFRGVLVSTHPLLRGDGLRATDVRVEQRDVTRLGYGYIDNIEHLAGRTLSRALPANSVLTPQALGGRQMVRAGDHVEMIARLNGIVVRANGIALGSGDSGARLRVRNADSGKVVDGIVQAPGQVIALP